ncbi:mCG147118 [Mus musculus]|jgi:hypothetical protein|nr:mCG147118 [Mus musculus]
MLGSFRSPVTFGAGYMCLMWLGPTFNADLQAVNCLHFPAFWMEEQVFISFPLRERSCVFSGFSRKLWVQDLHAPNMRSFNKIPAFSIWYIWGSLMWDPLNKWLY